MPQISIEVLLIYITRAVRLNMELVNSLGDIKYTKISILGSELNRE